MTADTNSIIAFTDNLSLVDASNTTTQVSDKRLRVELAAIREMQEQSEISIRWISKENQLADVLTKKGAPCNKLLSTLQNGNLNIPLSDFSQ